MKLPLLKVSIRRDAFTTTPVTVPEHELKMVRAVFGKDNVTVGAAAGERDFEPDAEYERLTQKYGPEKTVAIYGEAENSKLPDDMKPKKAAGKADPKAGE
jgi:hypothetical protein